MDQVQEGSARHLVGQLKETKAKLDHVMALTQTRRWKRLVVKTEMTILMIRLDSAGEIMILYKPRLDEAIKTIRTIDFNVETTGSEERHAHQGQLHL